MTQRYTHSPLALSRMANGLCPECGYPPSEHTGWGGPGCTLTDNGAAARIAQFEEDRDGGHSHGSPSLECTIEDCAYPWARFLCGETGPRPGVPFSRRQRCIKPVRHREPACQGEDGTTWDRGKCCPGWESGNHKFSCRYAGPVGGGQA